MTDGYFDAIRGTNKDDERKGLNHRMSGYVAAVFTPDGNSRVYVKIKPGDTVDWKRNGTAGTFRGVVKSVGYTMRVELLWHDGVSITPRIVHIKKGLHHAYRNGKDLAI